MRRSPLAFQPDSAWAAPAARARTTARRHREGRQGRRDGAGMAASAVDVAARVWAARGGGAVIGIRRRRDRPRCRRAGPALCGGAGAHAGRGAVRRGPAQRSRPGFVVLVAEQDAALAIDHGDLHLDALAYALGHHAEVLEL